MNDEEKAYQEEMKRLEQLKEKYSKSISRLSKIRIFGWIILIAAFIIIPKSFGMIIVFILLALYNLTLPVSANEKYNNIVNEINQKRYQYEHSPEKEKEKKEKDLQRQIEMHTPFKSVEEKGDYYIHGITWELSDDDDGKLKSVEITLYSETKNIKYLYYKYKGEGMIINAPVGMWEENFLNITRSKIYSLRDEKKYAECENLFREVFKKDPFTGEDLEVNKE